MSGINFNNDKKFPAISETDFFSLDLANIWKVLKEMQGSSPIVDKSITTIDYCIWGQPATNNNNFGFYIPLLNGKQVITANFEVVELDISFFNQTFPLLDYRLITMFPSDGNTAIPHNIVNLLPQSDNVNTVFRSSNIVFRDVDNGTANKSKTFNINRNCFDISKFNPTTGQTNFDKFLQYEITTGFPGELSINLIFIKLTVTYESL